MLLNRNYGGNVMSIINFITLHWSSILVVILFIIGLIVLVKKGYTKYAKQIVFYLVCEAESEFGSGTGTLKYAAVTAWLYDKLPAICKFFFTEKQIDKLIEDAVVQMKEWLESNSQAKTLIADTSPVNK